MPAKGAAPLKPWCVLSKKKAPCDVGNNVKKNRAQRRRTQTKPRTATVPVFVPFPGQCCNIANYPDRTTTLLHNCILTAPKTGTHPNRTAEHIFSRIGPNNCQGLNLSLTNGCTRKKAPTEGLIRWRRTGLGHQRHEKMNVELQLHLSSWMQTVLPGLNMPSCHQRPFLHGAKLQRKSNVTRGRSKKAKTTPAQHTSKAKGQQAVKMSKGKPYKAQRRQRQKQGNLASIEQKLWVSA